jgi:hypothetical protein
MARRFLGWRLPENFHPDAGISFNPVFNKGTRYEGKHKPIGTNLFDADQAEAMVRYMAEGLPSAIAAMGHTPPSGGDGELVRDLHRHAFDDCGCIPPRTHIAVQAADRLTALLSDVGVLREALEPFARYCELNDCAERDGNIEVPISDLRKASTALQGIGGR